MINAVLFWIGGGMAIGAVTGGLIGCALLFLFYMMAKV